MKERSIKNKKEKQKTTIRKIRNEGKVYEREENTARMKLKRKN